MKLTEILKRLISNSNQSTQSLLEVREGIANFHGSVESRLNAIEGHLARQSQSMNEKLGKIAEILAGINNKLSQGESTPESENEPRNQPQTRPEATPSAEPSVAAPRLPMPQFSLSRPDPIADFIATPEFAASVEAFKAGGMPGQPDARACALVYALVRKLRPEHVVDFDFGKASAGAAMARALEDNGGGWLHLVSPRPALERAMGLPPGLRGHVAPSAPVAGAAGLVCLAPEPHRARALEQMKTALHHLRASGYLIVQGLSNQEVGEALGELTAAHPGLAELGANLRAAAAARFAQAGMRSAGFAVFRLAEG